MPKTTLLKLMAASDNLWAMLPASFETFMLALEDEARSLFEDEQEQTALYSVERGVAIIPIDGVVLRRQFWGFGAGLQEISAALSAALADPQVRAILFSVCSPGGQARGVKELSDAIFAARAKKPCAAWVDGLCASAAYWLASATGRIYAGPSSEVGSIGVIVRHMDRSGANEQSGLNFTYISAGSHKALGNPDSALSEKAQEVLQSRVDAIYEMFCADVAQRMGLALENRLAWADGRDFLAGEAASLGLVTSIVANRDEAIANLLQETFMDKAELAQSHPELLASIEAEAKEAALREAARKTEDAVAGALSIMETVCGKESADKVRALVAAGMTPAQLEAAAKVFARDASAQRDDEASARARMLEAIKQAAPRAASAAPAAQYDDCAAFIQRVGAM